MISQELKDQIEKESLEFAKEYGETTNLTELLKYGVGYVAAATKYAEKLEEKDKEIAHHKRIYQEIDDVWDRIKQSKDREIEQLKTKLAQLKEIAEKIIKILHNANQEVGQIGADIHDRATARLQAGVDQTLTVYAEWCKQNLK